MFFEYEREEYYLEKYLQGIKERDLGSMEAFYHLTATKIYAYALALLKNRYDAEDVLHNVYLKVYEAVIDYRNTGRAMAWIMTIARNLCLEKLRERKSSAFDENILNEEDEKEELGVSDRLLIRQVFKLLAEEERKIVILHAVSGLKHREIAAELNLPLATVLSKYHRAIKKLKINYLKEIQDV